MSSKSGPRAAGTDGTDFLHRQRVAAHYQESANNKFILKFLYAAHFLILIFMWAKVGSEVLRREAGIELPLFQRLDLPSAYPWEYIYCFSFSAIIYGLLSFPRNRVMMIKYSYYAQFFTAVLPCVIGMFSQLPELFDYFQQGESSKTPTFKGSFPMVIIWYIFFIVSMQVHVFAMHFSNQLFNAWSPVAKKNE